MYVPCSLDSGALKGQSALAQSTASSNSTLEATQEQMDGFFSQLPYKCHLE